jgi:hypothetical protein
MASWQRLSLLALLGGVATWTEFTTASAGQQQNPPADQPARITNVPATNAAVFQSVPQYSPYFPPYYNPWYQAGLGGALSGTADVINAQGQFMVQQQQAFQMREQYRQMKIETRRKHVDEYLYERNVLPTQEDERERLRLENLRRSRNDPPLTEIWSGKALNNLLLAIQQIQGRGYRGPSVALEEDVLRHINVTSGKTDAGFGVLRDDGRITWPLALRTSHFGEERKTLDQLAAQACRQAQNGAVDADVLDGMTKAVDSLSRQLKRNVDDLSANDYMRAKRFLNDLNDSITILQDPMVSNYITRKWSARGNNVAELTQEMGRQGLLFARASSGDENAYLAVHRALVAYFDPPSKPWDAAAK